MKQQVKNTTTANANATELQVMNQAANAAKPAKTEKAPEKPAKSEKAAKKATAAKLDFTPALSYLDRVRAGRDEIQSLNQCYKTTCRAYSFLKGLNFKDFAAAMNSKYHGKHSAKKGYSAWYAAQIVEAYIAAAARDANSIDHAAARNYLVAEKLQRDAEGLRKL